MRSNWDQATDPRPATECPHCGEERMVERIDTPRHPTMYCSVCGHHWRVALRPKDS